MASTTKKSSKSVTVSKKNRLKYGEYFFLQSFYLNRYHTRYLESLDRWITTDRKNKLYFWDLETERVSSLYLLLRSNSFEISFILCYFIHCLGDKKPLFK